MPKVSVIVPIYNVEKYLKRCVDSILAQTFTDFELILVDDGSPDNCGKICDEYAEKDSRIKVIHKQNGGLSDARNAGIDWCFENSDFEWITFIDSDDWVHPEYLERLYQAVIDTDCCVSVCDYLQTDNQVEKHQVIKEYRKYDTEAFFCAHRLNVVVAWGKLYKRECFTNIRYPIGKLHEDEFITYKILFNYREIVYVDSKMYFYYFNENSITKSAWKPERLQLFEALDQQIKFFKKKKYKKARLMVEHTYIFMILKFWSVIEKDSRFERYKPELLRKLRIALIKYRGVELYSFKNDKYPYEIAFGRLMALYWFLIIIKKKIKGDS